MLDSQPNDICFGVLPFFFCSYFVRTKHAGFHLENLSQKTFHIFESTAKGKLRPKRTDWEFQLASNMLKQKNEKITSAEWVIVSLKYLIEYTYRNK